MFTWIRKQSTKYVTMRAAIVGSLLTGFCSALIAVFAVFVDRIIPQQPVQVVLITAIPDTQTTSEPAIMFRQLVKLPTFHNPPTTPGYPYSEYPTPTLSPNNAIRIQIPRINVDAPIVLGDSPRELIKGVGQLIGTKNPGEKGVIVLSAYNDIYGELFRYLDRLKEGDKILLFTTNYVYEYRVAQTQIVEKSSVEFVYSSEDSIVLLTSSYPYLIDNKFIIDAAYLE